MTECVIGKGILIDDVESVLGMIRNLSNCSVSDIGVVKRFITHEKHTHFYIDANLNSYMQPENNCVYLWLDTGYVDAYGNPILISLLKCINGFVGHIVGTLGQLCNNVKRFFGLNRAVSDKKVRTISHKYAAKSKERMIQHIVEENKYLVDVCNDEDGMSEFAIKLKELGCLEVLSDDTEEEIEVEVVEEKFTPMEEQITTEILLEKMADMENYIEELLLVIETESNKSKTQIMDLQEKNEEYKRVILQMRNFVAENSTESTPSNELLGRHRKILVIGGSEVGVHIMQGIAKGYGFSKTDFEFVEYDKSKSFTDRIRKDGKYVAVIFGSCPHKTAANSGYSSAIEKLRQLEDMPYVVDARTQSGKLKMTKESFKKALEDICNNVKPLYAY